MNLDPGDHQIHILLINIDSLSHFFFTHKPAGVGEKYEELNLGHGRMLTD